MKAVHDLIGVRNVVFSTDFPHPDCKYPGAVERFLKLPLPDTAKRAILWDNCARYYGLAERTERAATRETMPVPKRPREA